MKALPILAAALALAACGTRTVQPRAADAAIFAPVTPPPTAQLPGSGTQLTRVPLRRSNGMYYVPVSIYGVEFMFLLDTGSTDTTVHPKLALVMAEKGMLQSGVQPTVYRMANGTHERALMFVLPPLTVGGRTVTGVVGSTSRGTAWDGMLLGQSFLRKFRFWAIDNATHTLILG